MLTQGKLEREDVSITNVTDDYGILTVQGPKSREVPPFLPSSLPSFLPSFLPPSLPACLPPFLPSFLPSVLPSFPPSFFTFFLPSFPPSFFSFRIYLILLLGSNQ
jgi:hypothetical protein